MYYNWIYVSERIDSAKCNNSKEYMVCHYWFFNHGFRFEILYVCNGCHDLIMLCLNISDTAIITVKVVDYRCIIHPISKYEATHLLENSVLHNRGNI